MTANNTASEAQGNCLLEQRDRSPEPSRVGLNGLGPVMGAEETVSGGTLQAAVWERWQWEGCLIVGWKRRRCGR
ncbi:hypothetical protein JZ751_003385 [Albula glossodonta]|uniref:Uncharacterized protein n=1 Tax=Albula glossodonta TaxID=121402 RepID=A0A8T2N7S4_9TELE|nr:hypothetical protein JZ751_003385 [Albula glossodonta]